MTEKIPRTLVDAPRHNGLGGCALFQYSTLKMSVMLAEAGIQCCN